MQKSSTLLFTLSILLTNNLLAAKPKVEKPTISACGSTIALYNKYDLKWNEESKFKYKNYDRTNDCTIRTVKFRKNEVISSLKMVSREKTNVSFPPKEFLKKKFSMSKVVYYASSGDLYTKFLKTYNDFKVFFDLKKRHIKIMETVYKDNKEYVKLTTLCPYDGGRNCNTITELGLRDIKKQKKARKEIEKKRKQKKQ